MGNPGRFDGRNGWDPYPGCFRYSYLRYWFLPSDRSMFGWPSWYNMRMLCSLAMPDLPYHALPLWEEDVLQVLRQHLKHNPGGGEDVSVPNVSEVLLKFYDDPYACTAIGNGCVRLSWCRGSSEQSWPACVHMCTTSSTKLSRTSWWSSRQLIHQLLRRFLSPCSLPVLFNTVF